LEKEKQKLIIKRVLVLTKINRNIEPEMFGLLHDGVLPSKKEALEIFSDLPPGKQFTPWLNQGVSSSS